MTTQKDEIRVRPSSVNMALRMNTHYDGVHATHGYYIQLHHSPQTNQFQKYKSAVTNFFGYNLF